MARFTRIDVALKARETGVVPVFYHADAEIGEKILKACYDGGARVFEFTNRGDYAHEVFTELTKYAAKEHTPAKVEPSAWLDKCAWGARLESAFLPFHRVDF